MKVFISWSGDRSRMIAEELRDWLPTIVQSLEPFISTQDVPVGGRGLNVLASQLQDCSFGILCLTQENKQGPWIHFEAGALSKVIEASRVVPLLFDLKISDLTGPLVQFQAIAIEDREGVFSLIKALAGHSSPPIAEGRLQRLFEAFWPELEEKVSQLKAAAATEPKKVARSEREILEEILLLSRNTERKISSVITDRAGVVASPTMIIGSMSFSVIRGAWEEILETVKANRRVAWVLLSNCIPKSLVEDILTIKFVRYGDAKAFLASGHDRTLEDAILDIFGVRLRIAAVAPSGATPSPHPADDTSKELTGLDLVKRELGGQVSGEPSGGYSDESPF